MQQVLQDLKNGETIVERTPIPDVDRSKLLIQAVTSLISTGTERMIVDFGRAGLLAKARQQPDKVKMVVDKVRTDGLLTTVSAVKSKLDQKVPLGYANVGRVAVVGSAVTDLSVGDRVVSNGCHAEYVCVGRNLCARIPDNVSDSDAAFTVPAAIALQSIRLAKPTLGECFVVTGLGLIGLLVVQILRANGCRVLGIDVDSKKTELARGYGAEAICVKPGEDPIEAAHSFSRGRGVDGVIIAASSKDNSIIQQAATMCRKRARIVLLGVIGLELKRSDFYEKEISFQVSCSYGPGRYESDYEEHGHDYPIGFVRWTEQRNFEAVLDMMSSGQINTSGLVSREFQIEDAASAYSYLSTDRAALGILLRYSSADLEPSSKQRIATLVDPSVAGSHQSSAVVGVLGAGNYSSRILLPALKTAGARLRTLVSSQGVSGTTVGRKMGFEQSSTDAAHVFEDEEINAVVVATRHDSHAGFVIDAIRSGKSVFVEKPLALSHAELDDIESAYQRAEHNGKKPIVMVGFNRRFAPFVRQIKNKIENSDAPISLVATCNAGAIDGDSWVQDISIGGGRIIGEACHFIDLARYVIGSTIADISAAPMVGSDAASQTRDTASITIRFENGSLATVHYFANGHRSLQKERLEVFQSGQVMVMNNFRSLIFYGARSAKKRVFRADRGQQSCVDAFVRAVESGTSPIQFSELIEVSRAAVDAAQQVREK